MPAQPLATSSYLASHTHEGGGNIMVLVVFLGVIATAVCLIFSELRWVHTVSLAVAGWVVVLSVAFVL